MRRFPAAGTEVTRLQTWLESSAGLVEVTGDRYDGGWTLRSNRYSSLPCPAVTRRCLRLHACACAHAFMRVSCNRVDRPITPSLEPSIPRASTASRATLARPTARTDTCPHMCACSYRPSACTGTTWTGAFPGNSGSTPSAHPTAPCSSTLAFNARASSCLGILGALGLTAPLAHH